MFCNLSKSKTNNFPFHYTLDNGLILSTDSGWTQNGDTVSKGYKLQGNKGNYCSFVSNTKFVNIEHEMDRSFPLWASNDCITNLYPCGSQVWADSKLTIDSNMAYTIKKFSPFDIKDDLLDEQVINLLHETLLNTYEEFLSKNTAPLKIFLSGGIDTTTAWAYLDYFTKKYEIVDYEYVKFTPFYKLNSSAILKFWGYKQIHLWDEDCVLVTGSNGDENFLRGPFTLAIALKQYDLDFKDILEPDDYHYKYLLKKQENVDAEFANISNLKEYILNRNINDHQHWHLDRTITFTPFKDISLLSTILSSSKQLLVKQAKDAYINKELIRRLDASKLEVVSNQKNYFQLENT
jgi:hypothetical protein